MAFTKLEPGDYPGIGGSDISSILGLNKYRTALDFWEENKGVRERFNGNLPTNIGLSTEQLNMSVYQKRTHNIVYYYQAEIDDWFRRSPDGIIRNDEEDKLIIFEAKSSFSFGALKMFPDENDAESLPQRYQLQCQWYMARPYNGLFATETHLSAILTTPTHRLYTIPRDPSVCSMMLEFADDWWKKYIVGDIPPPKKQGDDAKGIIHETTGNLVKIEDEKGIGAIEKYIEARETYDSSKRQLDSQKKTLMRLIGDEDGIYGDWGKITNKPYERTQLDKDRLYRRLCKELGEKKAVEVLNDVKKTTSSKKFYTSFK